MRFYASRTFKVIDFSTNRKLVCDFLVINYDLNHFASFPRCSAANEVDNRHTLTWAPIARTRSNFVVKLTSLKVGTFIYFSVKSAWSYLQSCRHTSFVSCRRLRQTTWAYHDNSRTSQCNYCNVRLQMYATNSATRDLVIEIVNWSQHFSFV